MSTSQFYPIRFCFCFFKIMKKALLLVWKDEVSPCIHVVNNDNKMFSKIFQKCLFSEMPRYVYISFSHTFQKSG